MQLCLHIYRWDLMRIYAKEFYKSMGKQRALKLGTSHIYIFRLCNVICNSDLCKGYYSVSEIQFCYLGGGEEEEGEERHSQDFPC